MASPRSQAASSRRRSPAASARRASASQPWARARAVTRRCRLRAASVRCVSASPGRPSAAASRPTSRRACTASLEPSRSRSAATWAAWRSSRADGGRLAQRACNNSRLACAPHQCRPWAVNMGRATCARVAARPGSPAASAALAALSSNSAFLMAWPPLRGKLSAGPGARPGRHQPVGGRDHPQEPPAAELRGVLGNLPPLQGRRPGRLGGEQLHPSAILAGGLPPRWWGWARLPPIGGPGRFSAISGRGWTCTRLVRAWSTPMPPERIPTANHPILARCATSMAWRGGAGLLLPRHWSPG